MRTLFSLRLFSMALLILSVEISTASPYKQSVPYIYVGKDRSRIIQTLAQIEAIDDNDNSPLSQFNESVANGAAVVTYDTTIDVLEYSEDVLENNMLADAAQLETLKKNFAEIAQQVISGELTIALPESLDIFADLPSAPLFAKRLVALNQAVVVSTTDIGSPPSGLQTIDGVTLVANNRVLLVGQTNAVQNGVWLAQSGSWTRPTDFATGNMADQAYVLVSSGTLNGGSGWLCTTPTAVIDTDPVSFVLFVYPDLGTNTNTPNTLVARDSSGAFSAGMVSITDTVISNSIKVTPFTAAGIVHNNTSGALSSSLIVNADIASSAAIADSKLATLTTAGKVSNSATTANSANLANAIVSRDSLGNFSAGTITATLSGNATSATSATTATSATSFTGSLVGDVTGTQGATVVSFVGGQSASNVASATNTVISATSSNTANTLVKRNASGNFSAGVVSVTDAVMSNSLTMTPFSTAGIVHNNASGLLSSSLIVNADIATGAAITDSKLATISTAGKVANSATTATSLNTANAIVARDSSGNINATTVIASLLGTASNNVLKAGDTMTGTLQLPAGSAASPSLTFTGSTTAGLSTTSGNLLFSTNGLERFRIASGGTLSIKAFTAAGIIHNDAVGNLSSSLVVDSDISASAGIVDSKLATISSTGKVANSATTATNINNANTIVSRDVSGNFAANEVDVVNLVASGNITLSTDPSTSTAGTIVKGSSSFIHDYGTSNTFMGVNTGNFTMTGTGQNSIFGSSAFSSNSTGNNNTGIGYNVLAACTTGNSNIAIGSSAGITISSGSGNIYINADAATSSESSTTRIGTSQTACFIAGIGGTTVLSPSAVVVNGSGQLGTIISSEEFKHNIQDMAEASEAIYKLRPVTFVYNGDETDTMQYGLIAEEVDQIFPDIVVNNRAGKPETVQYHVLPVLLLNEMKKQQVTIDQMQDIIASLQEQVTEFIGRVRTLEHKI